ncbi:hypothetical protein CC77DRAFT_400740 [Alternaria alternata]|jgi:hypothetical protein|uniref:Uncharacterized protein n=1 Tax=Alternaria alternata TaxID=5599 RepID=A0A177DB17_ALTAL|nr:hypothetical protein CC77DRAFT_400740 [Alternaria alternata]OAG16302.1 hypothetical protein CC77DRAFT_400740 [Alternaria alternata]
MWAFGLLLNLLTGITTPIGLAGKKKTRGLMTRMWKGSEMSMGTQKMTFAVFGIVFYFWSMIQKHGVLRNRHLGVLLYHSWGCCVTSHVHCCRAFLVE